MLPCTSSRGMFWIGYDVDCLGGIHERIVIQFPADLIPHMEHVPQGCFQWKAPMQLCLSYAPPQPRTLKPQAKEKTRQEGVDSVPISDAPARWDPASSASFVHYFGLSGRVRFP